MTELHAEHQDLLNRYNELFQEYNTMKKEHDKLKHDFSENTVIESMNDMKIAYQKQEKKMEKLQTVIDTLIETMTLLNTLITVMIKNNKHENRIEKIELDGRLKLLKELLQETLKNKNEILYMNYLN